VAEAEGIVTEKLVDGSEVVERGRYAVVRHPDGAITISRRVYLCDDCQGHDCGEHADPLEAPGWAMKMLQSPGRMKAMMRMFGGPGGGGDDDGS